MGEGRDKRQKEERHVQSSPHGCPCVTSRDVNGGSPFFFDSPRFSFALSPLAACSTVRCPWMCVLCEWLMVFPALGVAKGALRKSSLRLDLLFLLFLFLIPLCVSQTPTTERKCQDEEKRKRERTQNNENKGKMMDKPTLV